MDNFNLRDYTLSKKIDKILDEIPQSVNWFSLHELIRSELYILGKSMGYLPLPEYKINYGDRRQHILIDLIWYNKQNNKVIQMFQIESHINDKVKEKFKILKELNLNVKYIIISKTNVFELIELNTLEESDGLSICEY